MIANRKKKTVKMMFGTGASSAKTYNELYPLIRTVLDCGIFAFDTAPSYRTEAILGACLNECIKKLDIDRDDLFIQTKIDIWQMAEGGMAVESYIESVIKTMEIEYLDAVCIHWPVPEYMEWTWDALVKAKKRGLVENIGICNLRMRQLQRLPIGDIMPDFIQIERHPLRTCKKEIEYCSEKNIAIQAYSPLCKMNKNIAENPDIYRIAERYGKNVGQIVLKWHIESGVTPIFTSRKKHRIREYALLEDFLLTKDEKELIDSLNQDYKMYLESLACPGF